MSSQLTGGCLCGSVRYEISSTPVFAGNCHCRDCQRATGSAFAPSLFVPLDTVKVTGQVKYYEVLGDSGSSVNRGFCPECGARLFGKSAGMPTLLGIMAGSLDEPETYAPLMDIFTESAQPWDFMNPHIPKFPQMPDN
ncbi:MAG: GFA family protein [Candidatus Methylumidiphilus sp.]